MSSLLLVDDEPAIRLSLQTALRRKGWRVEEVGTCGDARRRLESRSFDAVVADYRLPDGTGLDLLRWLRGRSSSTAFVMMTGFGSIPLAVQAMRDGASHFLSKPVDPDALTAQLAGLRADPGADPLREVVAVSAPMREVLHRARQAGSARGPVLLTGRTGAGKEVVARHIHESGPRRARPFVTVNCASIASSLFESEMFGHVRGAYTGADGDRAGVFREAHTGTLFLDEVLEIPVSLQAKLLRVIETGEFRPVGASSAETADVRILAAANVEPMTAVREGRFREDLYYRLAAIHISVPPLSERREDILPLAEFFLRRYAGLYAKEEASFDPEARRLLEEHEWAGNVRELRNAVEQSVVASRGGRITAADLPLRPSPASKGSDLATVEKHHILRVLAECGGNKAEAARKLAVSKSTLRRKLLQYEARGSF